MLRSGAPGPPEGRDLFQPQPPTAALVQPPSDQTAPLVGHAHLTLAGRWPPSPATRSWRSPTSPCVRATRAPVELLPLPCSLYCTQVGYNSTIKKKDLPYGYMSLTFGTFGSFGEGTWRLITKACDPATHPKAVSDCDPWQLPGPKRDFILTLGFSLQRANSRMIRNADSRRRNARNGRKYASGTRSF